MDLEEIRPDIAILRNATDELRNSSRFRYALAVSEGAIPPGTAHTLMF